MTDDRNLQFNSEQIRDLLSPYLDNEVTAEERRLVEQGLAASVELRQELESLRRTVMMLAALPPMPAPRPFTLTEAQVRPAAPTVRKGLFGLPWWVQGWAALAATLLCVLAAGGVLWRSQLGQNSAVMPAAEIANAPQMTVPASERDTAAAVVPTESPNQKAAAVPSVAGGVDEAEMAREAVTQATDQVQVEAVTAVPAATLATQETTANQAEALVPEEKVPAITATPTAGEVTTLAQSQPVLPPAADQEAATQSLAAGAAPNPAPTLAPMATNAAPAMKESVGAAQSSNAAGGAPPAEIPPTTEVQSYAAPAQEAAPIVPATATMGVQAQTLPSTATIAPSTATPTALPSPTPLARLTLPAASPVVITPVPTATNLPSTATGSETRVGSIIAVILAVVIIFMVIWLNRNRSPR